MQKSILTRTVFVLLLSFLVIAGLYFAKPFLVPFTLAGILSMVFLPLCRKMESIGMKRAIAVLLCVLLLVVIGLGIVALLSWQIADFRSDLPKMQEHINASIVKLQESISNAFGVSPKEQQEMIKKQQSDGGSKIVTGVLTSLSGMLVNSILVLVYIFLLMYLRTHLKQFILKLVPAEDQQKAEKIINQSSLVAQHYLTGLAMMIGMLWIMYGIGFSIVGVKHAIFFAILCGILEIVPFIGNITGTILTLLMAMSQGANSSLIIGILITYACVQFIQTYILEPLVVGAKVKINPLITIAGIVIGELIWGIPGMILAIPVIGILKVIFDNMEDLKPYGFLMGEEKKEHKK